MDAETLTFLQCEHPAIYPADTFTLRPYLLLNQEAGRTKGWSDVCGDADKALFRVSKHWLRPSRIRKVFTQISFTSSKLLRICIYKSLLDKINFKVLFVDQAVCAGVSILRVLHLDSNRTNFSGRVQLFAALAPRLTPHYRFHKWRVWVNISRTASVS